jgi:hypothetical protein
MTTLHDNCPEIWKPQPSGTLRACANLNRDCFTLVLYFFYYIYDFVLYSIHDKWKET